MIGGFMGVGSPNRLINALVSRGAQHLTVIANDTARPGVGIGSLITAGAVLDPSLNGLLRERAGLALSGTIPEMCL
jgi:acetate CoA/acetoacetate CoA-transferase alpha subunit